MLNKSYNFGCENYLNTISNAELKKKSIGYEMSSPWVRNVQPLGTNRPNSWVRIVQSGYDRRGYETSRVRNVHNSNYRLSKRNAR